jgi:hypothetical protein
VNRPSDASASAASFVAEPVTRIGRPISGDETIGAPDASGRRATPVGVFLPVANLQDQPLRIPDSIAFEDWPDTPDSEPEAGARSPEGASMAASEPGPEEPAPSEEISATPDPAQPDFGAAESDDLAVPEKPAEAAAPADWQAPDWQTPDWQDPNRQPDPSAGQPDRFQDLLARLETGIDLRRLSGARWLLPAGITACAVLLVAGLAVGIIPIPGEDRQTAQLAQDLDEPAAGDPDMSASLPGQQDVPVAPAGSDLGNDSAAGLQPEEAAPGDPLGDALGDAAGDAPGASQLAALPEPGAPNALDSDREPIVDFMRIDPDGKAVVAGRAAPGTELTVLDNGEPLGTVTADIYGLWTFVSQDPLSGGRHEIGLRRAGDGGRARESHDSGAGGHGLLRGFGRGFRGARAARRCRAANAGAVRRLGFAKPCRTGWIVRGTAGGRGFRGARAARRCRAANAGAVRRLGFAKPCRTGWILRGTAGGRAKPGRPGRGRRYAGARRGFHSSDRRGAGRRVGV